MNLTKRAWPNSANDDRIIRYGVNDFPPTIDQLVPQSSVQRGFDTSQLRMSYQFLSPLVNTHADANGSFWIPPSYVANNGLNVRRSTLRPS
jgi:hypothetical protein